MYSALQQVAVFSLKFLTDSVTSQDRHFCCVITGVFAVLTFCVSLCYSTSRCCLADVENTCSWFLG